MNISSPSSPVFDPAVPASPSQRDECADAVPPSPSWRGGRSLDSDLLHWIVQTAADPRAPRDKLDRLIEMQERRAARAAKAAFDKAFAAMQPDLPIIIERGQILDKNGLVQSRYALWEDLNEAIRPILARHKFSLSFRVGSDGDRIGVTCVLTHRSGHSVETGLSLPADLTGGKNPVQGIGSATSYGKRYTAQALLNLTSRGEDDDARAGGGAALISAEQLGELERQLAEAGADRSRFLAYLGVAQLEDLPDEKFSAAQATLRAYGQRRPA